jgi:hypothetical protein
MNNRIQGIIAGILITILLFGGMAAAAWKTETIDITFRDISIVVDGEEVTPMDANGKIVEPFIYEGTTYLPVRAVGQALDMEVSWSSGSNTVYIKSKAPGEPGIEQDPVTQIIRGIANRDVIDETLFSSVSDDQELTGMLRRYNELTSYLFGVFFERAATTIVNVTIDGFDFSAGVDFSYGSLKSPPSYPFAPERISESAWRIAIHSLYPDVTERIEADPYFSGVLAKEAGGSYGMWPEYVHSIFNQ